MRLKKKPQQNAEESPSKQTPEKAASEEKKFEETKVEMPSPKTMDTNKAIIEEIRDLKQVQQATSTAEETKESVIASETRESEDAKSEAQRTEPESNLSEQPSTTEQPTATATAEPELEKPVDQNETKQEENLKESIAMDLGQSTVVE